MSKDTFILHEWEKEKMDKLKEMARLEDAKTEGFERGMNHGLSKGINQGRTETMLDVTKNLLKKKISLEIISECTGLTKEEILQIQKEITE